MRETEFWMGFGRVFVEDGVGVCGIDAAVDHAWSAGGYEGCVVY